MFKSFILNWKHMSGLEKFKFVMDIMVDIGAGAVTSSIVAKNSQPGLFNQICGRVAGAGMGLAVAKASESALNSFVDDVDYMMKNIKYEKKEA